MVVSEDTPRSVICVCTLSTFYINDRLSFLSVAWLTDPDTWKVQVAGLIQYDFKIYFHFFKKVKACLSYLVCMTCVIRISKDFFETFNFSRVFQKETNIYLIQADVP